MTPAVRRVPTSTYRLQITEDLDLVAAARVLPYLHDLGVDWVYLSPILAAEADSEHGYDVADHSRIDPARGGGAGLAAVAQEARRLGMGVLVDIVPNHVGVANPAGNGWWWSVLTLGQASPYAEAFDIDWAAGGGRLRIPVVGDDDAPPSPGGPVGNLRVEAGQLHYYDNAYPLAPGSADDLGDDGVDADTVHARQHYELVSWRLADAGLNYRRFFAVSSLAAVRVEEREWFDKTHSVIGQWLADGLVDGLRVDHPDGLRDPAAYLDDLASLTGNAYVLVEKILEPGEAMPTSWATAGTTGYDVLALVDRVLTDPAGETPLTELEDRLHGAPVDWHALVHDNKRRVADGILRSEVLRIGRELWVALADAPADTEDAVAELLACFPVYRSYLPDGRDHLEAALASARSHRPDLAATLDVLGPVLGDPEAAPALRFQQTSGMVMAKGVEDTSFYQWARLTSLNEVGGDPSVFSVGVDDFHVAMAERQRDWPAAMTTLSTHDTKRGEDVRARITALAEVPDLWAGALDKLLRLVPLPDSAFGSLLWQAILGAWPATGGSDDLRARLHGYAEKAMREAGRRTTWTAPDAVYEAAVHRAADAAFDVPGASRVLDDLLGRVVDAGWSNALAAKLMALTMPGVPDVYQGSELWEQSLVDPDNRRPVDFEFRAVLLAAVDDGARPRLAGGVDDPGATKLLVTRAALRLRRDRPELFSGYTPLSASGAASSHVLAFDRGGAVTVVTRLPLGLAARGGWGDTILALPAGEWVDEISGHEVTGGDVDLAGLLADFPVALLRLREPAVETAPSSRGRFDVWAPRPDLVRLSVGDEIVPMERAADGWWRPSAPVPEHGEVDYGYLLDDDPTPRPDPRSRRQPRGVHERSRTFDPAAYTWSDGAWTGRQLAGSTIYELHVGTFTPEGTLDAALGKLDHLKEIGVDLVELMPVNAVNGEYNWGYDGVLWSAVHEVYGGPAAYQRFVDGCHAAGLGVVQDVVHNHLGPSGNYLPLFAPYLKEGRSTWGDLVNLDGDDSAEVRRLVLDNVRMWFEDFHVDGLRLDAVHALHDESPVHLLEEMAVVVAALSAHHRRPMTLIAESDLNDPRLVTPREAGGYGLDAQWNDDVHHAVHVALTGETDGYYADFSPLTALAKVMERGFFHDGTWSSFRGRAHGLPIDVDRMPAWRLVVCCQNHDQIGNRARGDRLTEALDDDQLVSAAMLTLCSPFTPMLFQGEEWAASSPFQFFTSHPEPDLGRAVADGRMEEFARMGWDAADVPDPQDPATYDRSNLDWSELELGRHAVVLEAYRRLAVLRRSRPELTDPDLRTVSCTADEERRTFTLRRRDVLVAVNVGDEPQSIDLGAGAHELLFTTPTAAEVVGSALLLPPHAGAVVGSALLLPPHAGAVVAR